MKFLCRFFLLCLIGLNSSFAQNTPAVITASSCEKPEYPTDSKRLGEEGTVQLKFLVGVDGKVMESAIEKSSGFRRLDEAARAGLSKCQFKPATVDGKPQQSFASIKYTMRLEFPTNQRSVPRIESITPTLNNAFTPFVNQSNLPLCRVTAVSAWNNCYGSFFDPNEVIHVGEFKEGVLHGSGSKTFKNGSRYVGLFNNGVFNGLGTYTFANGDRYFGEFNLGIFSGLGAISYENADKYSGQFKAGMFNGQGTLTYRTGQKFLGVFRNGKFDGIGTLYAANGSIINQGIWVEDVFLSSAPELQTIALPVQPSSTERDRLTAETEAERKKRLELDQQFTVVKERDRITAELDLERRKRQELEAQLAATPQPTFPQTIAPRRTAHALVIGNAAYPGSGRLENSVNDANAISQKLKSMGFIVTTVTDANRQRLVQSMAQFRRTAASADISLLYYAGHGVQIFGTNYILPTDVDQTDPAQATIQGVSLNSVVENFLPGKTKLVFLDACRDNALQRTNDRSVSKGLAPISAAEGTLISYATKDGQTAADGVGSKNSPFTQALLEHLNDPQDIAVVLRKVRERVMKITGGKQQPWEYGSLTGGELVLSAIKPK